MRSFTPFPPFTVKEEDILSKSCWKGGALLAPLPPVLVSCGTMEHPNVLTVAWTGIVNTKPPRTYISVRPSRFSYPIIKESGEFVLNLTTENLVRAADFCGVRSGRDIDKFAACHLTPEPSSALSAPMILESPVNLECRVLSVEKAGDTHDLFLAEVVQVHIDDRYLDDAGKLHLEQCGLVAYAHGDYYGLGKKLGSFGYSVRKKKKHKTAPNKAK